MANNTKSVGIAYSDPEFESVSVTGSLTVAGNTISGTEMAFLDGVTAGTVTAGKAVVTTTDKHIDALVISDGGFALGAGAGTVVSATAAELNYNDITTLGVSQASKVLTTDAAESLLWATTDATASETVTLSVADTRTGAGAVGWSIKGDLISNVALGSYANGVYGILSLGAAGKVTGLGAGVAAEIVMGAGCTDGTYAALELEFGMGTNAVTGTASSFMYLSLYGSAAATFDTNGYMFQLAGYTKGSGKFVQDTTAGSTIRPVQVIKVKTLDGDRYLPLYSTAAIAA